MYFSNDNIAKKRCNTRKMLLLYQHIALNILAVKSLCRLVTDNGRYQHNSHRFDVVQEWRTESVTLHIALQ